MTGVLGVAYAPEQRHDAFPAGRAGARDGEQGEQRHPGALDCASAERPIGSLDGGAPQEPDGLHVSSD